VLAQVGWLMSEYNNNNNNKKAASDLGLFPCGGREQE
jgi:hypothetical protein